MAKKITCYNCNGLGEKTRQRGNHPIIHRTTKCYTCNGEGELEISDKNLKEAIIFSLKKKKITTSKNRAIILWNETKTWCEENGYIMGGSYANRQDFINVTINTHNQTFRFKISFEDLI